MKYEDLFKLEITGRVENENGANTHYVLDNESIITRKLALSMHKAGLLEDYEIIPREDELYLRAKRNHDVKDNIDEQPLFTFTLIKKPEQK